MSDAVKAAIAADLATLTREVDPPSGPLGYGRDLSCVLDVTPDFAEIDPMSLEAISQALIRRLITPRGALVDDPDYGLDLRGYCNRGATTAELRGLSSAVRGECRKDDRVDDVLVTLTLELVAAAQRLSVQLTVTPADPTLATFTLTFAVTSAGVLTDTLTVTGT
jgi:hypothetical protein